MPKKYQLPVDIWQLIFSLTGTIRTCLKDRIFGAFWLVVPETLVGFASILTKFKRKSSV